MDYRCPHCQALLKRQRVRPPPHKENAIAIGMADLCCPVCQGGLQVNTHPAEGQLPYRLDFELAAYALLAVAVVLAALLQHYIPPLITLATVVFGSIAAFAWQQCHLYSVTLAEWPRYTAATLHYIEQREFPH